MSKTPPKHLRIVETAPRPVEHAPDSFEPVASERSLFAAADPNILMFVDFTTVDEAELLSLIISSKPTHVIDLRVVPRFDIGTLNRKLVFSIFEKAGARYHDLGALIGPAHMRQNAGSPQPLARAVLERVFKSDAAVKGPVAILLDAKCSAAAFTDAFAAILDHANPAGWQTMRVPAVQSAPISGSRAIIFISHATPNDNPFASWLSTQLTLSGYEVWTDFERLSGGELFWDTIEDIIRNRAAKVIVAASGLAQTRPGVLDEIALALSIERNLGLTNFVIPLRIDETNVLDFRANLQRRNILDFHGNWAAGLAQLLKVLEGDRVPSDVKDIASNVGKIIHDRLQSKLGLTDRADPVSVNWLQVRRWPSAVYASTLPVPANRIGDYTKTLQLPHVQFGDLLLSFAPTAALSATLTGVNASSSGAVATSEFLKGRWNQIPTLKSHIAQRMVSNLIRQAWVQTARQRNLSAFALASGASCWFLKNGQLEGNKAPFIDREGKKRTKSLVGFSQKRGVFWHFAVELRPLPNHPETLVIKPHVIFSEDGITPLDSAARMHALRRGFCKSWWNDRWRDLIAAFLFFLSEGSDEISLDAGGGGIGLSPTMSDFECPVSPLDAETSILIEESTTGDEEDPDIDEEEVGLTVAFDLQDREQ